MIFKWNGFIEQNTEVFDFYTVVLNFLVSFLYMWLTGSMLPLVLSWKLNVFLGDPTSFILYM